MLANSNWRLGSEAVGSNFWRMFVIDKLVWSRESASALDASALLDLRASGSTSLLEQSSIPACAAFRTHSIPCR